MNIPDTTLEIETMGRFNISVDGISVATNWPDETVKVFFCSLLSPLDLFFSWDRICRSMLDEPESRNSRRRLDEICVRPLNRFLLKALGFNPVVAIPEGIKIDPLGIHVDAHEFYSSALEGLRLLSIHDRSGALVEFDRAASLYAGSYLPELSGKIIEHTRYDLESLYQTAVVKNLPATRNAACCCNRKA